MERVVREGQVATAATYAHMFSSLPSCGRPTRLMVYDLHTLQNRFYLVSSFVGWPLWRLLKAIRLTVFVFYRPKHGNAVASLQSAIPLLKRKLKQTKIDCVAFPDDGAAKRFSAMFQDMGMEIIVCGKTRGEGDTRSVVIQDGNATGRHIVTSLLWKLARKSTRSPEITFCGVKPPISILSVPSGNLSHLVA